MAYDYREAVKDDVLEYINNEINFEDFDTLEELEEHLNEVLFTEDSVTGNASGSYTFNTYEAEENICHNLDLLGEALEEFGSGADYLITHGAEAADVTIRCYLLGECIAAALEEIEDDFSEAHEGRKPGVIRRFISRFERLTDSQGKHPRRQRWERSHSTIIDI